MVRRLEISEDHPLRKLFRGALDFGFKENPPNQTGVGEYIEEQILCEFIHADNFYKIEEAGGKSLEDIADMLAEGDIRLNAQSFSREFEVHKHIGDYTLFMLGMFPSALSSKKGKEFILGGIVVPGSSLSEHYVLQGQRSYRLASEFSDSELFLDLSSNFIFYRNVLELVRIFLESARSREYLKAQQIIGTDD
ncbi:MAG TPA: hypothetical protein DCO77_05720 [Nitrospiraceae bacterium]|nr:hypothetical protein [Nitrospiraceae bacterium]